MGDIAGLLEPGNIDLNDRPVVKAPDGKIATVSSMSFEQNGRHVLVPMVAHDGSGILDPDQAEAQFRASGKHLGIFDSADNATAYAKNLHKEQDKQYSDVPEPDPATSAPRVVQTAPAADEPKGNPFDQFDNDPDAKDPGIWDRFKLHVADAYYRGSLNGSTYLAGLAKVAYPDDPKAKDTDKFPDTSFVGGMTFSTMTRKDARDRYEGIVSDLARFDSMRWFEDSFEFAAAAAGGFTGNLASPESFVVGVGGQAKTAAGRVIKGAIEQGMVQGLTDPIVQYFGIKGGVENEYSFYRTLINSGFGVLFGGGMVGAHELLPSAKVKETIGELASEDRQFRRPDVKEAAPAPEPKEKAPEAPPAEPGAPEPAPTPPVEPGAPPKLIGEPVQAMPAHRVATADGGGVEVTPIVVEAKTIKTSADEGFDETLQPRDRDRAASEAQVRDIAANMDPSRLGVSSEADRGAPIVGPDGMVESGNGRALAIRSAYDQGGEAAQKYRDYLTSLGVDVSKYQQPILVRQRTTELTPDQRRAFTVAANQGATLTMSAPERALADSRLLEGHTLDLIRNPEDFGAAANADFVRAFVSKLPPTERGMMMNAEGGLSAEGLVRVRNAVLAKAYGDAHVLTRISEATSDDVRSISNALSSVAAEWAKLRSDIAAGIVRSDVDLTKELVEAVGRTADLRAKGTKLDVFLAQQDAFDRLTDPVESFMRMFYDPSGKRAAGQARITDALRFYAEEARKVSAEKGLDLGLPDVSFRDIQKAALERSQVGYDKQAGQGDFFLRGGDGALESGAARGGEVRGSRPAEGGRGARGEGELGLVGGQARSRSDELAAIAQRQSGGKLRAEQVRPAGVPAGQSLAVRNAGVPMTAEAEAAASPAREAAIKSLQQQAMDLAKELDIPLRQGRVTMRGALGIYKPRQGVVRVKELPDFEVVAHEMGHGLEVKVGQDLTDLTNTFGAELAPLVSNPAAYKPALHVKEGFAEWIRRYIGNPDNARQVAPGFATAFENFMEAREPELLATIRKASDTYRAYLEAPSVDAVAAVVRSKSEEAKGWRKVTEALRENGFFPSIKAVMQHAYTALLDDKAPVARVVRELAEAIKERSGGALVDLKAADNPEVLIRLTSRSNQAAIHDLQDGVRPYHEIKPNGPSMYDALAVATGKPTMWGRWDPVKKADFSTYLVARRAEVLWKRFEGGDLPNPPAAFSKADAVVAIADLERANPSFREASGMVHGYTRELLTKQYEGGLITQETFEKLMGDPFYVPFMRDLSDKPLAGSGRGGPESQGAAETVRRLRGSARDIIDPIESIMTQTLLVNRTLKHADVIRSLVRLSAEAKGVGGKYVEPIPAHEMKKYTFDLGSAIEKAALEHGMDPAEAKVLAGSVGDAMGADDPLIGSFFRGEISTPRGEPIVFYKDGGELKAARMMSAKEGHALYETVTALPHPMTDLWVRLIGGAATIKRSGIVSNPVFALTNYIRDQFAVGILRRDYIPIVSGISGVAQEFRQGESAKLYAYGGGVSAGSSIAQVHHAVEGDVDALAKKGYLVNRLTSIHGALELAAFTEAGTRNSVFAKVFEASKAKGLSDYEAMIEAAFQAQDLLDFSRHGSRVETIKNLLPFLNAHMQGLDKARRTILQPIIDKMKGDQVFAADPDNLKNAVAGAVKVFGVGGVLGAMWAAINSDSEAYKDASTYFMGTHVVIPMGKKIFLVPLPFELGTGFVGGQYAFKAFAQNDPRAAEQFIQAAWQALEPPNVLKDIPLVSTTIATYTGKNLFTGNDIVPDRLQRLPLAQQYSQYTSNLARTIGPAIGVSPMKVDYAIGDLFGTWGRDIMSLSQAVDDSQPTQGFEDRVFMRRLIKDPTRTSDVTTRFWSYMGQTTGKYNQDVNGYDALVKSFNDDGARQFLAGLATPEKAWVTLRTAADEDGKAAFGADEKRLHPLTRAYDAVTLLNGLRRELFDDSFKTSDKGEQVKLDPTSRRDLIENVRELAQLEMRNAFVIMKEPGYVGRQLFKPQDTMDKIRAISPAVADEIATRYATQKVYTTEAVARAYPTLQRDLVKDGSEADLGDLAADAGADGYEFGAERVKKPPKRRIQIKP